MSTVVKERNVEICKTWLVSGVSCCAKATSKCNCYSCFNNCGSGEWPLGRHVSSLRRGSSTSMIVGNLSLSLSSFSATSPDGSCSKNFIKAPGFSGNSKLKRPSCEREAANAARAKAPTGRMGVEVLSARPSALNKHSNPSLTEKMFFLREGTEHSAQHVTVSGISW